MITIAEPEPEREHPVVAGIAIAAILLVSLLIAWARIEVQGTRDLEAALAEESEAREPPAGDSARRQVLVDDAVTANRWASAFSP
jgi:hypothetical protein